MTTEVTRGEATTLISQWYEYVAGPATDVTSLTITITLSGAASPTLGPTSVGIVHAATGVYTYSWTPAMGASLGDYLVLWDATEGDTSEIVTVTSATVGSDVQTTDVWYCTREDVKQALDAQETARNNAQIDRAIAGATGEIEGLLRRRFYPMTATRYFPWPSRSPGVAPWRLWLGADEVIEVSELSAGGVEIAAADYLLEPVNSGPPYRSVQINLGGNAAFSSGDTWQRAISMSGVFGHSAREEAAGALAEGLDDSETAVDVTDSAAIGVGHILLIGAERMIVTGKSMLTTGQTVQTSALTASTANVTVNVTTGSAYNVGETILIDSERMLIVDISGNALTVKRQWDGSVLAAHNTGVTIYAPRTLTVTRGALGTTAATHATSTSITRHIVPSLVRALAIAESLVRLGLETAGYARGVRSGDAARDTAVYGLEDLRVAARRAYGRNIRHGAV